VILLLLPHRNNLSDVRIFQRYGILYNGYRPSRWFWESIIMVRKVAVQVVANLLTVAGFRLVLLLLVLGNCVLAQAKLQPYKHPLLNQLEILSLGSLLLVLILEVSVMAASGVSANDAALDTSLQVMRDSQLPIAIAIVIIQVSVVAVLVLALLRTSSVQLRAVFCKVGRQPGALKAGNVEAATTNTTTMLAVQLAGRKRSSWGASRHARALQSRPFTAPVAERPLTSIKESFISTLPAVSQQHKNFQRCVRGTTLPSMDSTLPSMDSTLAIKANPLYARGGYPATACKAAPTAKPKVAPKLMSKKPAQPVDTRASRIVEMTHIGTASGQLDAK
jgi:hypothetical protein